jgi:D-3-phosphoglycerate dehydrogenase
MAEAGKAHVVVTSRMFGQYSQDVVDELIAAGCTLTRVEMPPGAGEAELIAALGEADVLVCGTEPVTARVLEAAPRLRLVARHGIGYENVDVAAARARGIQVGVVHGAMAPAVADLALALLLASARQVPQGNALVKSGGWQAFTGPELPGKTLGIVGLGVIGKQVCRRARGFDLRVVAHDPLQDADFASAWEVTYLPLDDLLMQADFVTLHAPVTPATRGMIGAAQLALMKPAAYLINTARGALVDEAALFEALKNKQIAGAASDVFVKEPPGDNPLLTLDNFIAMPHCGSQTPESKRRMTETTVENILRVLRGEEPLFPIR